MKKVVGYIRSFSSDSAQEMQEFFIRRYCEECNISLDAIYRDKGFRSNRTVEEMKMTHLLGLPAKKYTKVFDGWEQMFKEVANGGISMILVDTKIRLFDAEPQKKVVEALCAKHGVTIIEVGGYKPAGTSASRNIAFYHYSNAPQKKTSVVCDNLDKLYDYALQHFDGWGVEALYFDLQMYNRNQYQKMLDTTSSEVIVVKNLYHIKRKLTQFMSVAQNLNDRGIKIISVEEGTLSFIPDDKMGMHEVKSAVVYNSARGAFEDKTRDITKKKLETFVSSKTKWEIRGFFCDVGETDDQVNQMMQNAEKGFYDVALVDSFGRFGENADKLYKIMHRLKIPCYSLHEGGISIEEVDA